jgi:hypothetical protein
MTNAFERETTINASDGDDLVRIWTAQRTVITRLRRHKSFTEVKSGVDTDGFQWAEFTIPADRWNPATGAKRTLNLTEEQRAERAARLLRAREEAG